MRQPERERPPPRGGRLQIGIGGRLGSEQVAGFKSESVADFVSEWVADLRRNQHGSAFASASFARRREGDLNFPVGL